MRRPITSLKVANTKCGNFRLFVVHGHSHTLISDQEDECIWKILAMKD